MAYRVSVFAIWALGVWNAWECVGLYADGAHFLIYSVHRTWFWDFDPARHYFYGLTQLPHLMAIWLGVTDLHWLGRIYSIALVALPTGLYHLALARAKADPVLLAVTIAAVSMVFMTTSFFIEGEYNTAYAAAIVMAVWLAASDRPRLIDGIVLVAMATLSLRTYQVFLYLGPLLAGMAVWAAHRGWVRSGRPGDFLSMPLVVIAPVALFLAWRGTDQILLWLPLLMLGVVACAISRPRLRPALAIGLYQLAAILLVAGSAIAAHSLIGGLSFLAKVVWGGPAFWDNSQFVLMLAASLIVVAWGLFRPDDLCRRRPYILAGCVLLLLALSPALAGEFPWLRPHGEEHYSARSFAGLLVAAIVVFIWVRSWREATASAPLKILEDAAVARRLLAFSTLMLLAVLPSAIFLTTTWISYLGAVRTVVRSHHGMVTIADTPLSQPPHVFLVDPLVTSLSLALRSTPRDGIVVVSTLSEDNQFVESLDLGRFFWRD